MSGLPSVNVEIAWTSGYSTAAVDRVWTDVSAYVDGTEGLEITYGRNDEQSQPDASMLTLTLNNKDGRFTPERAAGAYYPNVKKGKPIRVSVRYPGTSGNLLTPNQASMESSIANWSSGGSAPPTLTQSSVRAADGTKSLLVTWGAGGTLPLAQTTATGLVVGRVYTAQAKVYVPTGSPSPLLAIPGASLGASVATKDAWVSVSVTFTASASSHLIQVWPATTPSAGQQVWVDAVMLDEGSTVGTFTTASPPTSVRFTGYVNEWPLTWPTGNDQDSSVVITCSSRRARMGMSAPLGSAIRTAYLATDPIRYWPLDEAGSLVDAENNPAFRDITNGDDPSSTFNNHHLLAAFYDSPGLKPILNDPAPGPTDEGPLVRFNSYSDGALIGTFPHYIGAGGAVSLNPATGFTVECVGRVTGPSDQLSQTVVMDIRSTDLTSAVLMTVVGPDDPSTNLYMGVGAELMLRDPTTNAVIEDKVSNTVGGASVFDARWAVAGNGQIHHYLFTLTPGGASAKFYFDGLLIATLSFTGTNAFTRRFTGLTFGSETFRSDFWVGHIAVHDRPLTATEVTARADAATTASETVIERVARLGGLLSIPAAEINVEASVGADLGPQNELGRSAAEVLDEATVSSGGVMFDNRDNVLTVHARNHRYNAAPAFTLSTANEEIETDLTAMLDDTYLVNAVTVSRLGSDGTPLKLTNQASIDAYGLYSKDMQVVSTSDAEIESLASDILYRYAEPQVRVSRVSVDVGDLSASQRTAVLAADIGTKFTLTGLPSQAPRSSLNLFAEGYAETISATGGHFITFNTTPGDVYATVLTLDDPTYGVLDSTNVLAY